MAGCMWENGKRTICTGKVNTPGQTAVSIRETISMTKSTDLANILGLMEESTQASGRMVNSMAKESTNMRMVTAEQASGWKESALCG